MKYLVLFLCLCLGCQKPQPDPRPDVQYPAIQVEVPIVNLEQLLREQNWIGDKGQGSCVHATMVMLFRWQGRFDLAKKWRETYSNGSWDTDLARKFDAEGVRYAYTYEQNDVAFLEWACRTRRGCGVGLDRHMVMLVHMDDKQVIILDNNHIEEFKSIPRDQFLRDWFRFHSWAVTPVYTPPPPLPFEGKR